MRERKKLFYETNELPVSLVVLKQYCNMWTNHEIKNKIGNVRVNVTLRSAHATNVTVKKR